MTSTRFQKMVRWYPRQWQQRYGDEFVQLLDDSYPEAVPARVRVSIVANGLKEHARSLSAAGANTSSANRIKGGALVVLLAWPFFMVAGSIFAKFSEQWTNATPAAARTWPNIGYSTVVVSGIAGGAIVLVAALAVLPGFVQYVRSGGWSQLRATFWRAVIGALVFTALFGGMIAVAHSLTFSQRNGGSGGYQWLALVVGVAGVVALALGTSAVVTAVQRLALTPRVLQLVRVLAIGLGAAMVGVLTGTGIFWVEEVRNAPEFMKGSSSGWLASSTFPLQLDLAGVLMLIGLFLAGHGIRRMSTSRQLAT